MSKRGDKNLIVGLDIGTSKVVAIVGEINDDGRIEVVGIRKVSSLTSSQRCIPFNARSKRPS
jgi:cell division ATPase FtsA